MNRKVRFRRLLPLLRTPLAAICLVTGCATKMPDNTHSSEHGTATGFYQGFTNHGDSPLPKPTGPFAVGRMDRLFTDSSRDILYRSVTNGSMMTTIWYPAGEIVARRPGPYANLREMMAWIELFRKYGRNWNPSQIARLTNSDSWSFPAAPLASQPPNFPVVLYSHGSAGMPRDNTASCEELASHGFVVVGVSHSGTVASLFPDGTLATSQVDFKLGDTNPITIAIFRDKVRDLRFIVHQLDVLNAYDAMFAGRLDVKHIGVFGWSYGGAAAAELCNVEPRCKAGAALDPGGHPNLSQVQFRQPFMILAGDHGASYRQVFDRLSKRAYFVKIRGAGHDEFGDHAEFLHPADTGHTQAIVRIYLVAFFNRYLKDQEDHRLDGPLPDHPEIETFLMK